MNKKLKYTLIWFFSVIFTLAAALYQKTTGPTYPIRGSKEIAGQEVRFRLIRSYNLSDDAKVTVIVPDTSVKGEIMLRRYKSFDSWHIVQMDRHGDTLAGFLPHQPPAGKVMYTVTLMNGEERVVLNEHPAVLRYTGYVPAYILLPHVAIIFFAMLFSTLTGLMALAGSRNTYLYAWLTVITLTIGGMILGPVVQKFAFDAFWTGWPFGHDLTDNKSLVAFIFWIIALWVLHNKRENKSWPVAAAIVLLVVFTIPHSVLGSELDFTKEKKVETTR